MKYINILILCLISLQTFNIYAYDGLTKASVTIAGGIIKAQHTENNKKYKRKDCPVCKGKGWYISGDDITKVPCGYCEPSDAKVAVTNPQIITSSTNNSKTICNGPQCQNPRFIIRK